jgi:glutamyl-tRNA synthetase
MSLINSKVRVRFAPSPTGYNHSAGLRTALYNYLFAKKMGGEFYIRIEDTDNKRYHDKAVQYIKDSFDWCGIVPDDSPWNPNPKYGEYYQSKREYGNYVDYLLDKGFAYLAFDTSEELDAKKIPYTRANRHLFKNSFTLSTKEISELIESGINPVIRINVPENKEVVLNDLVRGEIKFNTNDVDDKVLVKSNGIPTYHLAHVVDDYLMETTHVLRGDEWIPSTPIHLLLWEMFGWDVPVYAHLSVILNPDGKGKLSKRTAFKKGFEIFPLECSDVDEKGDMVSFKGFKGLGFEPISYINFIALLGFNFGKDVLTLNEMIENFDLGRVSTSPSIFDVNKLNFINREHMLKIPNDDMWSRFDLDFNNYDVVKRNRIMELSKERAVISNDLKYTLDIFFEHIKTADVSDETRSKLGEFLSHLGFTIEIDPDKRDKYKSMHEYKSPKDWLVESHINKKELREVICGGKNGPELPVVMEILGEKEVIARIKKYL